MSSGGGSSLPEVAVETPWLTQGDIFRSITAIPALGSDGRPVVIEAKHGVVVISQTCDNVRSPSVQVAKIVELTGPDLSEAQSGRTPRYAALPGASTSQFAKLDTVATIAKSLLHQDERIPGVASLQQVRELAQSLGRRYGRFAFPDDVAAWLAPLQEIAKKKARRPNSPEGHAFARVRQIRVRSERGWSAPPYVLAFTFVLDEGELSFEPDAEPDPELALWLPGRGRTDIATKLAEATPGQEQYLFQALCEAWIESCAGARTTGVVADYSVEIASADEYTLAEYYVSEALDLDHLSGSSDTD